MKTRRGSTMRNVINLGAIIAAALAVPLACGGDDDSSPAVFCGDGYCSYPETCSTCPRDCGYCSYCGNGYCISPETCSTCPADCPCGAGSTCVSGFCIEACRACYTAWCLAEGAACDASPACVDIVVCQRACPWDTDCMLACYAGHTSIENRLVIALTSCVEAHCSAECPDRLPVLR